jgi:hypothetical protein
MTNRLAKAFEKAFSLSDELQDQLAEELLEEIEWESRWDETLASSGDKIDKLAERAEHDYRAGTTVEMGFDEL